VASKNRGVAPVIQEPIHATASGAFLFRWGLNVHSNPLKFGGQAWYFLRIPLSSARDDEAIILHVLRTAHEFHLARVHYPLLFPPQSSWHSITRWRAGCEAGKYLFRPAGTVCASSRPWRRVGCGATYVGNGLRRREVHSTQARSDIAATMSLRYSDDNGRAWLPFERLNGSEDIKQNGNGLEQLYYAAHYDSVSVKTIDVMYQRNLSGRH